MSMETPAVKKAVFQSFLSQLMLMRGQINQPLPVLMEEVEQANEELSLSNTASMETVGNAERKARHLRKRLVAKIKKLSQGVKPYLSLSEK